MWTMRWHVVHNVHMRRGQKAPVQSVDSVDSLDGSFKSLYPFCLFFKQKGWMII